MSTDSDAGAPLPEDIFNDALEEPAERRSAFVAAACRGDEDLRQRIMAMVELAKAEPSLLTQPRSDDVPEKLGRYDILGARGRGSMGIVFRARDTQLGREVALKILPSALARDQSNVDRFAREAHLLAALQDDRIATLHSYEQVDGQHFITMEFVEGQTLDELLASAGPLSSYRSAAIAHQIAAALVGAHARGIVHRDLKPANIMVMPGDRIKILDFGIAQALGGETREHQVLGAGVLPGTISIGTPGYMSPEQARGESVDHRCDIWGLGKVIQACLTGHRPADSDDGRSGPANRRFRRGPSRIDRDLHRFLSACLQEQVEHRLFSAAEAERTLEGILEQRRTRALRLARRVGVAVAVTAALAIAVLYARSEAARQESRRESYLANLHAATIDLDRAAREQARGRLEACPSEYRGWEWRHLRCRLDAAVAIASLPESVTGFTVNPATSRYAQVDASGVVRVCDLETHRVICTLADDFPGAVGIRLQFTPAGDRLLVTVELGSSLSVDSARYVLANAHTGATIRELFAEPGTPFGTAFSPGGDRVAISSLAWLNISGGRTTGRGTQQVFDLTTGRTVFTRVGPERVGTLGYSPDGRLIAVCSTMGEVSLVDAADGSLVRRNLAADIGVAAFSDDSRLLAVAGDAGVLILDTTTGEVRAELTRVEPNVASILFLPGSERVVCGYGNGSIVVWDIITGSPATTYFMPSGVSSCAFDGDQARLFAWCDSGPDLVASQRSVWIIDPHVDAVQTLEGLGGSCVAFDPSGTRVAAGSVAATIDGRGTSYDCSARIWDAVSGEMLQVLRQHLGYVHAVAFDPAGARLLTCAEDKSVRLWDLGTATCLVKSSGTRSVTFSGDGQWFATGSRDSIFLHDRESGRKARAWALDNGSAGPVFSRDGRFLAACTKDTLRVWNVESGRAIFAYGEPTRSITAVAVGPRDRELTIGFFDGTISLVDIDNSHEPRLFAVGEHPIQALAFVDDGGRIVVGDRDGLRICDTGDGAVLINLSDQECNGVAVSPDGATIAAQAGDRIRLWRTEPAQVGFAARSAFRAIARIVDPLLDQAFATYRLVDSVQVHIERSPVLGPDLRVAALRRAEMRGGDPDALERDAWALVRDRGLPSASYERAIVLAREACRLNPLESKFSRTLGVGYYRVGEYALAREYLARSDSMAMCFFDGGGDPVSLAYLVLTYQRLGLRDATIRDRDRLDRLMSDDVFIECADCAAAFAEVLRSESGRDQGNAGRN
jgi:WD40 repeat protein/predicted Ser/Thr protein kinase